MQIKTFKYLLYPTSQQEKSLDQAIDICRNWYNICLEERKLAWEIEKRNVNKFEQMTTVPFFRKSFRTKVVTAQSLQSVCNDLDKSFKSFFRRVKAKQKAGYPRFKGKNQFRSFNFPQYGNGIKIDGRRIRIFNVGRVHVRWDKRKLPNKIKAIRIIKSADRYYVSFTCELDNEAPLPKTGNKIGIDVNLENLLTDSNGKRIENPRYYIKAQKKLRLIQRSLQRKKKYSINRKKAKLRLQKIHQHIKNQRKDFTDKLVNEYIQVNDLIVLEKLKVQNMVRNRHLSKGILDVSWGYLGNKFQDKAANAGREIILVKPHNTSKTCSSCGKLLENVDLSVRWINCNCGLSLARDHNAAINILNRGIAGWGPSLEQNIDSGQCALKP